MVEGTLDVLLRFGLLLLLRYFINLILYNHVWVVVQVVQAELRVELVLVREEQFLVVALKGGEEVVKQDTFSIAAETMGDGLAELLLLGGLKFRGGGCELLLLLYIHLEAGCLWLRGRLQ